HGALGVDEWAAEGYPASAMRNYLARLGWSHGDEEFFTDAQALEWFDLDGIRKAPARFDTKKLANLSGQHIAAKDDAALVAEIGEFLALSGEPELSQAQESALSEAMYCLKDRAKTYPELIEKAHFVLTSRPIQRDDKSAQALDSVHIGILIELTPQLQNASWNRETLEGLIGDLATAHDTKLGKLAAPLRAALAGRAVSPSVFDMMLVLGREETVLRLTDATT
ncbi:MAG: glutamate--tRNA ligase family protein, partial [Pseudomonadota bacterium]